VQILPRCGHTAVAQRGLDKVNWASSVQGMAGVGVAKPMARHGLVDASPLSGFGDDLPDLGFIKWPFSGF
jgi:hypothetical protein